MKAYRDNHGVFYRTQAEAKASGRPFDVEIIPNDQQGLIDYMNAIRPPERFNSMTVSFVDPDKDFEVTTEVIEASPYRNGDPTTPFMKSRDPSAIFTCTQCGANNRNP